jgi:amino acid adenylation domain-containing protein/non-ribosomal peptide synthase protein (TIGR01720 family)
MAHETQHFRLSLPQARLWSHRDDGAGLRALCAVELEGAVDAARLRAALAALVARHEILRTFFPRPPGLSVPVQAVAESGGAIWEPGERGGRAAGELLAAEARRSFDLEAGPLIAARLLRGERAPDLLLLHLPALVADARSLGVLVAALAAAYGALDRGGEEPVQYLQFSEWQHGAAAERDPAAEAFWSRHGFAGAPPPVLPWSGAQAVGGAAGTPAPDGLPRRLPLDLEPGLAPALEALAARLGCGLPALLLTAWRATLERLCGAGPVRLEVVVEGRPFAELDTALGSFARPLSLAFDGGAAFGDCARAAAERLAAAEEHQFAAPAAPAGGAGFEWQEHPPAVAAGGVRFVTRDLYACVWPAALRLVAGRRADGAPFAELQHRSDALAAGAAERLAGCLGALLADAARHPQRAPDDLELLTAAERRRLLVDFNRTAAPRPELLVHELFAEQVRRAPERPALVAGEETWSYGELAARVTRLAARLRRRGVGPEVRVALLLDRSPQLVVGVLAVLEAGGAYLPLALDDPPRRRAELLAAAGVRLVLTRGGLAGALPEGVPALAIDAAEDEPAPGRAQEAAGAAGAPMRDPAAAAYVLFTSGSTGRPKGVVVPHRAVVNYLLWAREAYAAEAERGAPVHTPLTFDLTVTSLLVPLVSGASAVLLPEAAAPAAVAAELAGRGGYRLVKLTPSHLELLGRGAGDRLAGAARRLVVGGEALTGGHLAAWRELAPRVRVVNEYGPTEATVGCCTWEVAAGEVGDGPLPIGRPIANVRLVVVDRRLRPVPAGVAGELTIAGAGLARGYLDRPAETAAAFVPDPFGPPGGRRYRTGDRVRLRAAGGPEDWVLEFVGRLDRQIKLRGVRLEPGEVEAALAAHPAVAEAVVVVREDAPGDRRLVAYAARRAGAAVDPGALRDHLAARLPAPMVPAAVVLLDRLPLTRHGKVDRAALPAPDAAATGSAAGRRPPRTEAEVLLAGIWAALLRVDGIGRDDDFFRRGGHSLLAAQLISRVRRAFGVELPLAELFRDATLAGLAARIGELARAGVPPAPPLERRPPGTEAPLSFAQQRLWFLDRLLPGSPAYHLPSAVRLRGRLEVAALAAALGAIARRHEALRTRFPAVDGEPVQRVDDPAPVPLPVIDLTTLPAAGREAAARALARAEARRPFDLAAGPLFRARLLRLAADDHVALFTLHHAVSDGWSVGLLVGELKALYRACRERRAAGLPALPVHYSDYARWQRGWLAGDVLAAHLDYWRRRLAGAPPTLELPADRPRPAVQSFRGATLRRALPPALTAPLWRLGAATGATPFMVLVAAFAALLHRWSGQHDLVLGTPVAGRNRLEVEGLIGLFVNTLVLRFDLAGDPSFGALLAQVRAVSLEAQAHQELPFEKLVQELEPRRDLSRSPVFQVLFAHQNEPQEVLALPGLETEDLEVEAANARLDLTLSVVAGDGGGGLALEYARDLFDPATARRLVEHYVRLLAAAAADPGLPLSALPMLSPAERQQLVVEWNAPRELPADGDTLERLVAAAAARTPDAVAVEHPAGQLSYRGLLRAADAVAAALRRLGVGPEVPVGLFVDRTPELPIALLGVLRAGGAYVPVDPAYPRPRIAALLEDSAAPVVVVSRRTRNGLPEGAPPAVAVEDVLRAAGPRAAAALAPADAANLAYLIYTSGSTGRPKAVAIEHRQAVAMVRWAHRRFGRDELDAVLVATSICFDLSVYEIFVPLAAGGRLLLADRALDLPALPGRRRLTLVNTVPSALEGLGAAALPRSVRTVNLAGEPLPASLARALYREAGVDAVYNLYGPSEDTTYSTWQRVPDDGSVPTIGRPVDGSRAYVLDRRLRPAAIGVVGELCLAGRGVSRGYRSRPGLTAAAFRPDPFGGVPGARMYRTGDLVRRRPDGELVFLGRRDHQVKVRGYRIELREIEHRLDAHAGVRASAVVARGEGERRHLVAYLVLRDGTAADEVRADLARRVPSYLVPEIFVPLDELPLTPNGKVDRAALPDPDALATPDGAPRDLFEAEVLESFRAVLGRRNVGIHDGFFDHGGHSLLAMRLLARIRDRFGADLEVRTLFEAPSVAALARRIDETRQRAERTPPPPLVPLPRTGGNEYPLSFAQERIWFFERLAPGSAAYNVPAAVRLAGPLSIAALGRALAALVERHETLRTTFPVRGGRAVARVADRWQPPLPRADLAALPPARRRPELQRLADGEAARPMDLERGPLLRSLLIHLGGGDDWALVMTLHHLIADGWSLGLLIRDLGALYRAIVDREPTGLPALPVQYVDFAAWQREWLRGEVLERELDYWRGQLAGAPPVLDLPLDRPRPPVQGFGGGRQSFAVPAALAARVFAVAGEAAATPFVVLLTAYMALLGRYGRTTDLVVGTPVANRRRGDTQELIGLFVNNLALRARLGGGPSFRAALVRVRESVLAALAHQDVPFEKLVDDLAVERTLSHSPLFQVMFVLQQGLREGERPALPGVDVEEVVCREETGKYDLVLSLESRPDYLSGAMLYRGELFDRASARRIAEHYLRLLAAAVADPDRRLDELPLLDEAERRVLVHDWAAGPELAVDATPVHRQVAARAAAMPDAVAVAAAGGTLSYRELAAAAHRLAHCLRARGVGPGAVVGVCLERSPELAVAQLGVLAAGAAYLPLDPINPPPRLASMLEQAAAPAVVTRSEHLDRLPAGGPPALCLDRDRERLERAAATPPPVEVPPAALAYVIFTSGSTGRPKGVEVSHGALANLVGWHRRAYEPGPGVRTSQLAAIGFDASAWELWPYLAAGATVCLLPAEVRESPPRLAAWLAAEGIHYSFLPTALAELFVAQEPPADLALRALLTGGDRLRQGPPAERPYRVVNHYGPTENAVVATWGEVRRSAPGAAAPTIGRPIANTRVYLLDPGLRPVPSRVAGELCLGGDSLARGYRGRPAATAAAFVPDPFSPRPGARLYRTGDLGRFTAGGEIEFVGRLDDQVQVRGFRVEPGEVEAALLAAPGVAQAVVVARRAAAGGRLVAYVVPAAGGTIDADALRRFLGQRLPEFMVPAVVALDELPVTAHGKLDRARLPDPERLARSARFRPPVTPAERTLERVWAEVLRVSQVGLDDNFFDLGGDSILAIQIVARAHEVGLRLLPRHVFEHQTVAELAAAAVTEAASGDEVEAEQGPATGEVPLTPIQLRFLEAEPADPHHFNQALLFEVRRLLDPALLGRALRRVIEHHDALRLRLVRGERGWRAWIAAPDGAAPLAAVDLSGLPPARRSAAVAALAAAAQAGFDLAAGPLLRAWWIRLGDGAADRLLVVAHHLVVDGVSWRILLRDLLALYDRLAAGQEPVLPAKGTSFRRWAETLRERARSERTAAELEAWCRLAAAPDGGAEAAEPGTVGASRALTVELSKEATDALLHAGPARLGARFDLLLLAALALAFERVTGRPELTVEIEGHGRGAGAAGVDLSRTVGWFTSFHPLRLPAAGGDPVAALEACRAALAAVPGDGLGWGLLRHLGPPEVRERLRRLATPEVGFNYLGRLDQVLDPGSPLVPAAEPAGPPRSPRQRLWHPLAVDALVAAGRLRATWGWSGGVDPARVRRLADAFVAALEELARRALGGASLRPVDSYPLSPLQRGLLLRALESPAGGAYQQQVVVAIGGELDGAAFRAAWQAVLDHHPALRTAFATERLEELQQTVWQGVEVPLAEEDWSGLEPARREAALAELLARDRERGYDVATPPLLRLRLLRFAAAEHRLLFSFHHLILDGWSLPLLIDDLVAAYRRLAAGERPELAPRPPFRRYIEWLAGRDPAAAEAFWRRELAGFTSPTPLPGAAAGGRLPRRWDERRDPLPPELPARLERLARRLRVTPATVLHGAWALALARSAGVDEVVFGTVTSGRPPELPGSARIVGLLINTLPLRLPVPAAAPLGSWLRAVQERQAAVREHEHAPLFRLQEWSRVPPGERLFESLFVLENYPLGGAVERARRELRVAGMEAFERTEFPLTVSTAPGARIELRASYDADRFAAGEIAALLRRMAALLAAFADHPERRLDELPLLDGAELGQLRAQWRAPAGDYDLERPLHLRVADQARRTPDAVALGAGALRLTYRQLEHAVAALAARLRRRGVRRGDVVGVYGRRSAETVVALLAAQSAGAAYLPLDLDYPPARLAAMIEDARPALVLVGAGLDGELERTLAGALGDGAPVREPLAPIEPGALAAEPLRPAPVDADDAAYVLFTSGSTGRPKGVVVPHRAIANRVLWMQRRFPVAADDRVLLKTPAGFDASLWEIFLPLIAGARLVLAPPEAHRDADALARATAAEGITVLQLVPSLLGPWLAAPDSARVAALRRLFCGGEALPRGVREEFLRRFDAELVNLYGPTETAIDATFHLCRRGEPGEVAPLGRPLDNLRLRLLDTGGRPVPAGVPGEILVAGPSLARGYAGRPALTAERFVPDPLAERPGERCYRTGDLGRLRADGVLEFLGRIDDQVKIRGVRVEVGEVEAALGAHAGVRECAVASRDGGAAGRRLVAYVAPVPERAAPSDRELREHLRRSLPEAMVPAAFVVLERLPRTPSGKLDRGALPAAEDGRPRPERAYAAPSGPVEEALAAIWSELLGVERIGSGDDFFALGGHSLLATQMVVQLRRLFRIELPLRELFAGPTVAELGRRLVAREPRPGHAEAAARALLRVSAMSGAEVAGELERRRAEAG